MAVSGQGSDMLIAVAGSENGIPVGKGGSFTMRATADDAIEWTYYAQPLDSAAFPYPPFAGAYMATLPITVPQANVTYDVAFSELLETPVAFVWIASWAGGLRRAKLLKDDGLTPVDQLVRLVQAVEAFWHVVTLLPSWLSTQIHQRKQHHK